jgi:hypothetical protein
MNSEADRAQIESDEVAAVSVLSMGERANSARKTRMEDLIALAPGGKGYMSDVDERMSSIKR